MVSKDSFRKSWKLWALGFLALANLLVWLAAYGRVAGDELSVYFLDVGQGDAILIDSPTHGRVLIDGGKNRKVLSELGKVLPFGARRIDVLIATHPDADHIGGLPEVVSRYRVGAYIQPDVKSDSSLDDELDRRVKAKNIPELMAERGMVINFNDGARLTILFPNQDVSSWDTNDASVVARLTYGESEFLLTGDAGLKTEQILVNLGDTLESDVLKAGHHGSRTSTSPNFATAVGPLFAVISAGKDNSYGHPHKEVLNTLNNIGSRILNTAESGTIKFETDGKSLRIK
ncbi:MAG: ComEC/Rec2 family competence protein [bacterium]|nr:ComEC/Rec2 family competence protein [bacterium]